MIRFVFVFFLVLLTGCGLVKPYTEYVEEFSEMHVSADISRVLVIGSSDYFYIFESSKEFSEVLSSSLRKKIRATNFSAAFGYPENIEINAKGEVISGFTLVANVDELNSNQQIEALRIGFNKGKLYATNQYVKDGDPFPHPIGGTEEAAKKNAKYVGDILFLRVWMKGSRHLKADSKNIQEYKLESLSKKYKLVVIDYQKKSVDPKEASLMIFVTGAGVASCVAVAPLCFVAAVPMAGLRP